MNSKKNLALVLLTALLFLGAAKQSALAQKPERISFKESPAIVWEQAMPRNGAKTFVFSGQKGQTLKISFIEDSRKGQIEFEGKVIKEGFDTEFVIVLAETKEYSMVVSNTGNKASSFRIFMSLETLKPGNQPKAQETTAATKPAEERIKFPKGATSTKWDVKIPANGNKLYVLGAKQGQNIEVSFLEDTRKAVVDFGKQSIEEGLNKALKMKLPATKDYVLSVSNPTGKPLTVTIFLSIN